MTQDNTSKRTLFWTISGTVAAIVFGVASFIIADANHEAEQGARLTAIETASPTVAEKVAIENRLTEVEKDVEYLKEDSHAAGIVK
jgi:hypothetical protein